MSDTLMANAGDFDDVIIDVADLHVRYRVFEDGAYRARDLVRRRLRPRRFVEVHALQGIDLRAYRGEAVGVVGRNGSGKSTLLRTIAGLQPAERGQVRTAGEAHLLGVHAVLKPQLSGFRNITLGGLAMGLTRQEIDSRIDEVLEFADIGDAIGRAMQTYSSGMRARLAFAIATLRIPDVLLIDEALAVGDRDFRERSLRRINEMREEASTVILVSHNVNEIRATCSRTLWLHEGTVVADGPTDDVLDRYESDAR